MGGEGAIIPAIGGETFQGATRPLHSSPSSSPAGTHRPSTFPFVINGLFHRHFLVSVDSLHLRPDFPQWRGRGLSSGSEQQTWFEMAVCIEVIWSISISS